MKADDCPTCGAKMVSYKHGLSKGLVRSLAKMAKRCRPGESIHHGALGMNHNQAANFQKLRYFGAIEKDGDQDSKGGNWILTHDGFAFITGAKPLPKWVRTYQAKVIETSEELVSVQSVTDGWKYRPDYAKEAQPVRQAAQGSLL